MTVFKTYFKILKQNKSVIIMYTAILLIFTVFGTASGNTTKTFTASKPDVTIINSDINSKIVENLVSYIDNNANIIEIENTESKISDALFYKDINAVLYIYDGYTNDYLNNQEKELDVRLATDYAASYMKMLLDKYFKVADVTNNNINDEEKIISTINDSLKQEAKIEIKNTVDTNRLSDASYYYNFANYSILAVCIYLIATVMSTFNKENVRKRNLVSSKKISSLTKELYFGNAVFVFIVWLFVVIVSLFMLKDIMFSINGLWMIFNSFIFMFTALGIGFLTGTILKSRDAINGITNVVALGSSFMCGCFVPIEFMPDFVVQISKVWPTHWYISNNVLLTTIEEFNFDTLKPIFINMGVMVLFSIVFFVLAVIYNKTHAKS